MKELNESKNKNIELESELNELKNTKELLNQNNEFLQKIFKIIKEIYQLHFKNSNKNIDINNIKIEGKTYPPKYFRYNEQVDFMLMVTLEVAEGSGLPIYQEVKAGLEVGVPIMA